MTVPEHRRARSARKVPAAARVAAIAGVAALEFRRSRALWYALVAILAARAGAEFGATLAITDTTEVRQILYAGLARPLAVAFCAAHVAFAALGDFDRRLVEFVAARGVSPSAWVAGRIVGAIVPAASIAAASAVVAWSAGAPLGAAIVWAAGLGCETLVGAAFALAAVITLREGAVALVATLAFYLFARIATTLAEIADAATVGDGGAHGAIRAIVDLLARIVPNLDRYAPSGLLVGTSAEFGWVAAQTLASVLALGALGAFDLHRQVR